MLHGAPRIYKINEFYTCSVSTLFIYLFTYLFIYLFIYSLL